MNERMKKALSALLCVSMVAQNAPVVALATREDCTHHAEHTQQCGYQAAVEGSDCTHSHDTAVCGYVEAVEEVLCACTATDENGAPVHTEGCGYVAPVAGSDCTHGHEESCGYAAAVEGRECTYRCEICLENDDEEEEQETTAPSEPETTEAAEEVEPLEPIELHQTVTIPLELDAAEFDNDEAFAAYVERLFYGDSGVSTFGPLAGDRLTGADKALYDYLKAQVAEVADGTRTSVVFVFDPAAAGIPAMWSEEELGVTLLEGEGENLRIPEAGQNAIVNKFFQQLNIQVVLNALLSDCPYNMYWFNKDQETFFNCSLGAGYENDEVVGYVTHFIVTMYVSKDYRGEDDTTVDSEKPKVAAEAAATAKSVAAAQTCKTDYGKLVAYKEYICDAVSYNHEAVQPDYERGYGDPYQLIYVFDGDPTTNVVCEGYSKALQYLCDLNGPDCISVMGLFGDAKESENHMWNIVTLSGKNYLADVTNSEEGTVGQCGELFLVGNATGSVENGYLFIADGREFGYIYDSTTRSLWGADKLTLAAEDYPVPETPAELENHTLVYTASGSTITASCSANCGYSGTASVSAAGKTYDGNAVTATVTTTGALAGETIGIT
jgi:hypothetical protein